MRKITRKAYVNDIGLQPNVIDLRGFKDYFASQKIGIRHGFEQMKLIRTDLVLQNKEDVTQLFCSVFPIKKDNIYNAEFYSLAESNPF